MLAYDSMTARDGSNIKWHDQSIKVSKKMTSYYRIYDIDIVKWYRFIINLILSKNVEFHLLNEIVVSC